MEINSILTLTDPFCRSTADLGSEFRVASHFESAIMVSIKSHEYFVAFNRALDNALDPRPDSQLRSNDGEIFLRVNEILPICYEGSLDRKLCGAIQRRACEIMLDVSDPSAWDGALDVYGAAWRLSNVLPDDDDAANAAAPLPDISEQTLSQDLSLMVTELEQQIDQLNSELAVQLATMGGTDAGIGALQSQLERFRRPLILIKDMAASSVKFSEYFGAGTAGVRFIDKISDPIVAVLLGARNISLSQEVKELVQNAVTGTTDLVHRIAGAVSRNSDVSSHAENFEKRIKSYLVAEQSESAHGVFRDNSETWCPEMVEIPPGEFLMGSDDPAHQDEIPQRPVNIGYRLAVGRYPVTFEQFDAFCGATTRNRPDDNGWGRDQRPAINVSWDDAQTYVDWLSAETGRLYRLLSEAEWEYACRAGSTASYSFGDDENDLAVYGWYVGNLEGETRPVGKRVPNEFGLFDLHGNVWEWVEDVWHDNFSGTPPVDGRAWLEGGNPLNRVLRGGSWVSGSKGLRSSVRFTGSTDYEKNNVGFRVARTV